MEAVRECSKPTTEKDLQRFLGFANLYQRFICNYSSIAAPLTSLLKGGPRKLRWNDPANNAFDNLRKGFTTAPVLQHPDPEQPFIVEVDDSDCGVGDILSQHMDEK